MFISLIMNYKFPQTKNSVVIIFEQWWTCEQHSKLPLKNRVFENLNCILKSQITLIKETMPFRKTGLFTTHLVTKEFRTVCICMRFLIDVLHFISCPLLCNWGEPCSLPRTRLCRFSSVVTVVMSWLIVLWGC